MQNHKAPIGFSFDPDSGLYIFCLASIIVIAMYLLFRLIVIMFGGLIGAAVFGLGEKRPLTEAERIERSNYTEVTVYRD